MSDYRLITKERTNKNNEYRLTWGSILYELLPQHPQWGSNCCPCCMGVAAYGTICTIRIIYHVLKHLQVARLVKCMKSNRKLTNIRTKIESQ